MILGNEAVTAEDFDARPALHGCNKAYAGCLCGCDERIDLQCASALERALL